MSSPDLSSDLSAAELTAAEPAADELSPEEIRACLKVLNIIHAYDEEHPDYVSVRRATGSDSPVKAASAVSRAVD